MADRKQLITVEQFRALSRPTSAHLDEEEVNAYIRECEDCFIIPAIGYANFKGATGTSTWGDTFDATFNPQTLLDGGEWSSVESDEFGNKITRAYYCNGIRKALAYYVYAKLLRADGTIISRAGSMRHRDDNGDHIDDSKLKQYNDVMNIAERYLGDCLAYLKRHVRNRQVSKVRGSRVHIHAIGN